jgi:cytochrome c2
MRLSRASLLLIGGAALLAGALAATEYVVDTKREKAAKAASLTGGDVERAMPLLHAYGCAGCHDIPGVPAAQGRTGPALAGVSKRVYLAGTLPNTPENLVRFILHPRAYRPNSAMPVTGIDERGARDVAAYLYAH